MSHHAAVLESLGGVARVANVLGLPFETVRKWRLRGIPAHHWHRIVALDPRLTPEYLESTKECDGKPVRRRRRR